MCLPTCARPDGPPCYKVPRSLISSTSPYEPHSNPTGESKVHDTAHMCHECDLGEPFEDSRDEDGDQSHDQATLRREKSRVAAKIRRQKENQALVKLRLALPIQPSKLSTGSVRDLASPHDTEGSTAYASAQNHHKHTQSRVLTECALSCIPNYRAANSISRQHHLATPEFEKAVTVRLAGNALCLYDWLYTVPTQIGCAVLDRGCACCCSCRTYSSPSLSLFSQSLIAVVVDTTENTVVYAPPAYAQLIGMSWNTIIGLYLHELRFKQFSSSLSSQLINSQLSRTRAAAETSPQATLSESLPDSTVQQHHEQQVASPTLSSPEPTTNGNATDSGAVSTGSGSPKSRLRTRKLSSGPKRLSRCSLQLIHQPAFHAELWHETESDVASATLTTLLPPGPNAAQLLDQLLDDGNEEMSGDCITESGEHTPRSAIRQSFGEGSEVFAVCWATMTLPAHASSSHTSVKSMRHGLCGKSRPDANVPSRAFTSTLRVCLLNPVTLPRSTGDSVYESSHGQMHIGDSYRSIGSSVRSNLGFAPQTYHNCSDLTFLTAQSQFLDSLNYTHENVVGSSLLDFIHPDDLDAVSVAINSINETHPIITSFYRIRTGSGHYRWSRLIGWLCRRPAAGQSHVTDEDSLMLPKQDSPHSLIPNSEPPTTSDSSVTDCAQSFWIVLWHHFAHFDCTDEHIGLSSEHGCSKETFSRLPCQFSANDTCSSRCGHCTPHHQDLFSSPGCDPCRSTTHRTPPAGYGAQLALCCSTCRVPIRCGTCGTFNSFPSQTFDTPTVSEPVSYTSVGHHRALQSNSSSSFTSIHSVTPTNHDVLCSLSNLNAYGAAGDGDPWDMDGVTPVEDELVGYCSQDTADPMESVLLQRDTSCAPLLVTRNLGCQFDELHSVKPNGDKTVLTHAHRANKVDWARQAPSINPDLGEFELPGDAPPFCSSRRAESSGPSSTDADSFVLTPNLDLELHSSLPTSQQSTAPGVLWPADDPSMDMLSVGANIRPRLRNHSDARVDSRRPFLLPQAEIYAVPSFERSVSTDDLNGSIEECVAKRKRYTAESLDDPNLISSNPTATPYLLTELECLPDSYDDYRTVGFGADSTLDIPQSSVPAAICTSNPYRSDPQSGENLWHRQFCHHSVRLPTLRRLLSNQMTRCSGPTTCQVVHH